MNVRLPRAVLALLLCGLVAPACLAETTGIGPACHVDADCRGDRTCQDGICVLDQAGSQGGTGGDSGTGGGGTGGGGGTSGGGGSGGDAGTGGSGGSGGGTSSGTAGGAGGSGGGEATTSGGTGGSSGGGPACRAEGESCDPAECCDGFACLAEAGSSDFSCFSECTQHAECDTWCCVVYDETQPAACLPPEVCECGVPLGTDTCSACKDSECCLEANRCFFDAECSAHYDCLVNYCLTSSDTECETTTCGDTLGASSPANALLGCLVDQCAGACGLTQ